MANPDLINDVFYFQSDILGNHISDKPRKAENELKKQTLVRLQEEVEEFDDADTIADQADALVDLIYFSLGALHQMGVQTGKVWNEVHRANMSKKKGLTKRGDDNDAAKPSDWKAPDHSWLDEEAVK
jgi:predicted HAD superfamily Cof-like phosphohydrolase